jgi:acetyl-CoA carboxylase carboxyl transferase subunit beta
MAAGEAIIAGMDQAVKERAPFIIFAASGGARMQEGILSLMQMPRTTVAVQRLREARLPYVVVFTHPTTGGVTASYAMLGDIHIAEPGALIGFAGPRVIEQTIREQLPEGFQRSDYLLEHGMIDIVVHRHQMRETLARICHLLYQDPFSFANKDKRQKAAKKDRTSTKAEGKVLAESDMSDIEFVPDENIEIIVPDGDAETDGPHPSRPSAKDHAQNQDDDAVEKDR